MKRIIDYRAELTRKLLHVSAAAIPAAYTLLPREVMLTFLGVSLIAMIGVEVLRHTHARFTGLFRATVGFMVRRREWGRLTGSTYVILGAILTIALCPRWAAIAGLLVLAVADTAGALVGLRFGRTRFLDKTHAGSVAFFLAAYVTMLAVYPDHRGATFAVALVVTLVEALPAYRWGRVELNDNVTIPLVAGLGLTLLDVAG